MHTVAVTTPILFSAVHLSVGHEENTDRLSGRSVCSITNAVRSHDTVVEKAYSKLRSPYQTAF